MSLKEKIRNLKDKDLEGLLRKIEDSYILKGIDWIDDTLKLKEYESKSHAWYETPLKYAAKGVNFLRDVFFYGNIGVIPGDKQEKYAEYLGYDKLKFMRYSLLYGFTVDVVRFAAAFSTAGPLAFGLYAWGYAVFAEDCIRLGYMLIKKKPVGSFIYVEIPYRIIKPAFNYFFKPSKEENQKLVVEETNNLNSNNTLDLS